MHNENDTETLLRNTRQAYVTVIEILKLIYIFIKKKHTLR